MLVLFKKIYTYIFFIDITDSGFDYSKYLLDVNGCIENIYFYMYNWLSFTFSDWSLTSLYCNRHKISGYR